MITKQGQAIFIDMFDSKIKQIIKGYGYWTTWMIKRQYGKHPAIYIDKFVLPTSIIDCIPKWTHSMSFDDGYTWKKIKD